MFPKSIDIVKLPSFFNYDTPTKTVVEPVLDITERELFQIREDLITTFMQGFRPHGLVVNHLPQGLEGELITAIKMSSSTKKVLTLRGILFSPEKTNAEYFNSSMVSWIDEHFEAILVYTDPSLFRLEDHYDIPSNLAAKMVYTGYIATPVNFDKLQARQALNLSEQATIVLASLGGGQGTLDIWVRILEAIDNLKDRCDLAYLVTGPYLEDTAYHDLQLRVKHLHNVKLTRYTSELITWMKASDVFIGAGGANMLGEVLATQANAIIIPRQLREAEQEMHTSRLAELNIVRMMSRAQVQLGQLSPLLKEALAFPLNTRHQLMMGGAEKSVRHLMQIFGIG